MREEVFACDDYSTADWNSQTTTAAAGPLEDGEDLPGTFTFNPTVTVCPKLFGTPKMYQNGPQMSNYCAQLPLHTGLYIHG